MKPAFNHNAPTRFVRWTAPLTKRQREALDVIRAFIDERGYSPSYQEIGKAMGLTSLSTVHKHVHVLEHYGLIVLDGRRGLISAAIKEAR